jgi:hypothetical protein
VKGKEEKGLLKLLSYAENLKRHADEFMHLIPQGFFTADSRRPVPNPTGRVPGFGGLASGHPLIATEGAGSAPGFSYLNITPS